MVWIFLYKYLLKKEKQPWAKGWSSLWSHSATNDSKAYWSEDTNESMRAILRVEQGGCKRKLSSGLQLCEVKAGAGFCLSYKNCDSF